MTVYQMAWIVLIYAFIGWCCEVMFAAVNEGKFVNRGFLNGPVCPIYGFGMLLVVFILYPISQNIALLFIGSFLLTSALEFITGFILEKLFNEKWWDYSEFPFNIKGYVCLKFSLLWGLAGTFVIRLIHPMIDFVINKTPRILGIILLCIFSAAFIADVIITLINLLKFPKRMRAILDIEAALTKISDDIGEELAETVFSAEDKKKTLAAGIDDKKAEFERLSAKYKSLLAERNFVHRRLVKAFPNIRNGKYKGVIDRITNSRLKLKRKRESK